MGDMLKKMVITVDTLVVLLYGTFCIADDQSIRKFNEDSPSAILVRSKGEKAILSTETKEESPYEMEGEVAEMNVKFYQLDRKTKEKGKFLGTAELRKGKLTYDVTDPRLEKMLRSDYHTMVSVEEEGRMVDRFVTYKVGTQEHLKSIMENCRYIGCVGEITEK